MRNADPGIKSIVRIHHDGKVQKRFIGAKKQQRFESEVRALQLLEQRGCGFVPRLLEHCPSELSLTTTNCGKITSTIPRKRAKSIFSKLQKDFGIIHKDPEPDYITYEPHRGKFCVINFENVKILDRPSLELAQSIEWAGDSCSGTKKPQNEDLLGAFNCHSSGPKPTEERLVGTGNPFDNHHLFIVSDGMGGHAGGAVASQIVVAETAANIMAFLDNKNAHAYPAALIENSIHSVHELVLMSAKTTPAVHDMGATLVSSWFTNNELHFGNIGDSRLYRFRNGQLQQLSEDHSYVGRLVTKGSLTEEEARNHPRRNVLTQAMGAQCPVLYPQVESHTVQKNDWYLICSDGVMDGLWDEDIEKEFLMAEVTDDSPQTVAKRLIDRAIENAGYDDTTLFVIRAR